MNKIKDTITAIAYTAKFLAQSAINPNYALLQDIEDKAQSNQNNSVRLLCSGFTATKIKPDSNCVIFEVRNINGHERCAISITDTKPKIDDLADGDIRYWNPKASTQDANGNTILDTALIDIKADGSVIMHKNDGKVEIAKTGDILIQKGDAQISMTADNGILIKSSTSKMKIDTSGKISIGNDTCELVNVIYEIAQILSQTTSTLPGTPISSASQFPAIMNKISNLKI